MRISHLCLVYFLLLEDHHFADWAVDNLMDEDDEALINQQINDIYHAYIADQADQQVSHDV